MSQEVYLCVHVWEFPAQALLRLRPELRNKPVVVMEGEVPFQGVCSLNMAARALGVAVGMSRAEMDSFPAATLLKRSPVEESAAGTALLECAGNFSPRVEEVPSGDAFVCVLDIAGTEKLFGTSHSLAMQVRETFAACGVVCSIAVSANYHAAKCMARASVSRRDPVVIVSGDERQALSALPLSVLGMSEEHARTFLQWGVSTLGVLAMLPEKDLISRLGQDGKRLRQLARGESPHLLQPTEPVLALEERIELDSPVAVLDSLLFGVGAMLEQLIARATTRVLALTYVIAELGLEGGGSHRRTVRPALPSNDKQLWLKLLHLDWTAHPPQAAVISMMLRAEPGETSKVQLGLFSPQLPEPSRLDVTLARIRAVVGENRSGSVELKDSHEPEAFRMKAFSVIGGAIEKGMEPKFPAAAMRCLRPAEKIAVTLRNRCPHIFYFRGIQYLAEQCYGPWRAAGGWWTDGRWSVEEWDVMARSNEAKFGDASSEKSAGTLICCCMTRDVARDIWYVESLYD